MQGALEASLVRPPLPRRAPVHDFHVAIAGLLVGVLCFAVVITLQDFLTSRRLIAGAGILLLLTAAFRLGITRLFLLYGWVLSLVYSRVYYLPDPQDRYGYHGLYFIASDAFLAFLYLVWLYDFTVRKKRMTGSVPHIGYVFLPFALAGIASISNSLHPDWTAFECVRLLKAALLIHYLRHNLGQKEAIACFAAIGTGILIQLPVSIGQVVFHKFGAIQLIGEVWTRGFGTLNHPNILCAYLLMTLPVFMALAIVCQERLLKYGAVLVSIAGLASLVLTMSRGPWGLAALEMASVAVLLVGARLFSLQRALGYAAMGAALVAMPAFVYREKLIDRISGNFSESIDFRQTFNRAALTIHAKSPLTGVGMNNFEHYLPEVAPEYALSFDLLSKQSEKMARVQIVVHNFYLLILAESGILGLLGLGWALVGLAIKHCNRIRKTEGLWKAVAIGGLVGFGGVLGQQITEPTLWSDGPYYTFVLMSVLMNNLLDYSDNAAEEIAA